MGKSSLRFRAWESGVFSKVTKYNPDTGEPYTVTKETHKQAFDMDTQTTIATNQTDPYCFCDGSNLLGMEIHRNEDQTLLGVEIESVKYQPGIVRLDSFVVPDEVAVFALKHELTPRWFLVLYMS